MIPEESAYVWVDEKEVDEFYTTKFLELLLEYGYVWSPDDKMALNLNLGEDKTIQFLHDFSSFVEGIDKSKASKALSKIKEIYNKEYHKLLAASKNKHQSRFDWFSKAHKLFRESMVNKSVEGKENETISSQNSPAIESDVPGGLFRLKKDPLSPTTEDLTDSYLFLGDSGEDPPLSPSEIFTAEDSSSSRAEYFTDERPLSKTAETSGNDESSAFGFQTSSNKNSLVSRHEAIADTNSLPPLAGTFTESGSLLTTFENITRNTISLSPSAKRSLSPADRRSLSPAARSLSPAARRSLSPISRSSLSPISRSSLSPISRRSLSPAARNPLSPASIRLSLPVVRPSVSPTYKKSLFPATRNPLSPTATRLSLSVFRPSPSPSSRKSPSPSSRISLSPSSRRSLSPASRRSLSPAARRSLSLAARRSLSLAGRRSLSPAGRKSLSPAARRSLSPAARRSLSPAGRKSLSPIVRRSLSLAARRSLSPAARKSLSPAAIRSLSPAGGKSLSPIVRRSLSLASRTIGSSSNNVESASIQTNCPASEIKDHSSKSHSPHEILSKKEKSTSQGTKTADSCDSNNSEVRSFVQFAALQTIENVNGRSDFDATGAARGIDRNRIFASTATDILESLPPRLASECEAFILHFLQEILKLI